MKSLKRGILIIFLVVILINVSSALEGDVVISNSEDWKDVYSTILYGNIKGISSYFLTSTAHGPLILAEINKKNSIDVIASEDRPFVFNYPEMIDSEGFAKSEEIQTNNANFDLIEELPDVNNFIIVGDSYGYSAIAVAPYASLTNSWVFLADRTNIAEIDSVLNNREINNIIIYGPVDRSVKESLEKYNPEIINTGDRFKDNIEIVEKFLEQKPVEQVLLTNGEFIEKEIMKGKHPSLFTGRDNVPEQIAEWLKNSDIRVGVLIGNELVGAATNIRRTAGISVMVKFARGARRQTSGVAPVEGLDLFYLPRPLLELEINSVNYNKASSQLEITYKSTSNVPAYFRGTITLISDLGEQRVGDMEAIFIAPDDFKTVTYSGVDVQGENLIAEIYTLYGDSSSALDRILRGTFNVSTINVIDKCEIDVKYVKYNKQKEEFLIKVKNIADVDCWVDIELKDLLINEFQETIGTEGSKRIVAGDSEIVKINQRMTDEDLQDNSFVDLVAYYGEKPDSLVNVFTGRFELGIQKFTLLTYSIFALIIIIIILIIIAIIIKRREDDEEM
jgi:hypothetical protein